jgi:hypothetical protein
MMLYPSLERILTSAYNPCQEFSRDCKEMRWDPEAGHVPRGFLGACGESEVVKPNETVPFQN